MRSILAGHIHVHVMIGSLANKLDPIPQYQETNIRYSRNLIIRRFQIPILGEVGSDTSVDLRNVAACAPGVRVIDDNSIKERREWFWFWFTPYIVFILRN